MRKRNTQKGDKQKSAPCSDVPVNKVSITFACSRKRRNMRDLRVFACCRFACYVYARRDTLFSRTGFKHGRALGSVNILKSRSFHTYERFLKVLV